MHEQNLESIIKEQRHDQYIIDLVSVLKQLAKYNITEGVVKSLGAPGKFEKFEQH